MGEHTIDQRHDRRAVVDDVEVIDDQNRVRRKFFQRVDDRPGQALRVRTGGQHVEGGLADSGNGPP